MGRERGGRACAWLAVRWEERAAGQYVGTFATCTGQQTYRHTPVGFLPQGTQTRTQPPFHQLDLEHWRLAGFVCAFCAHVSNICSARGCGLWEHCVRGAGVALEWFRRRFEGRASCDGTTLLLSRNCMQLWLANKGAAQSEHTMQKATSKQQTGFHQERACLTYVEAVDCVSWRAARRSGQQSVAKCMVGDSLSDMVDCLLCAENLAAGSAGVRHALQCLAPYRCLCRAMPPVCCLVALHKQAPPSVTRYASAMGRTLRFHGAALEQARADPGATG